MEEFDDLFKLIVEVECIAATVCMRMEESEKK